MSPPAPIEQVAKREPVTPRVELVGQDRMADVGQVDADLVGPAGLGLARDQGETAKPLDDLVERDGILAAVRMRRGSPSSRGRSDGSRSAARCSRCRARETPETRARYSLWTSRSSN